MTCKGKVSGGLVVLEKPGVLPEGAEVRVEVIRRPRKRELTLSQKLLKWAGTAKGLPPDLARNHDHYLYGVPRK
jgi:hypothetical protein